jgi:dihydropteroate synthase
VSGGLADAAMADVAAASGADFVAMHWRGHSADMDALARYDDVVADVRRELLVRTDELISRGVSPDRIILDPGIGFAKTAEHNWQLLGRPDVLTSLGFRVLIGASRKRFLGALPDRAAPVGAEARDLPTAVLTALCAEAGAWGVRVHDVASSRVALDVVDARRRATLLFRDRVDTLGDVTGSDTQ